MSQFLYQINKCKKKKKKKKAIHVNEGWKSDMTFKNKRKHETIIPIQIKQNQVNIVCVEVLRPIQLIRVMSSAVSLPNNTFSWTGLVLKAVDQYLCIFFRQKLTTSLLESAEGRKCP